MQRKILLIDDNFHPAGRGAPLFSMERSFLKESGYDVYTLSFGEGKSDDRNDFIINTSTNRFKNKLDKFIGSQSIEKQVSDVINSISPDLIHNHLISKYPISVFNAIPDKIPLIQTLHGPNFFCPTSWGNMKVDSKPCKLGCSIKCVTGGCVSAWQYPLLKNLFQKIPKFLTKVDVFHCPSVNILNVVESFGFTNTSVIPLGLRDEFTKIGRKLEFSGNKILFIGSLHEVKGLDYLINAMVKIKKVIPDIKLYIAGRGSSLPKYKEMVSSLKLLENIEFLGFVPSSKITKLYQSVDITIVPSVWSEQFGMVGPESLACGVPVIASNVGGIPEWLKNNEFGVLVPPRDSGALSNEIINLIKDRKRLDEYSINGYEYIRNVHTQQIYKDKLLQLIEDVL